MSEAEVSVVVACSRPAEVAALVAALDEEPHADRVELVIVGAVPESLEARRVRLELVPFAPRHPNARRNVGVRRTRAPRIAFLDDDARPLPGWLEAVRELSGEERVIRTGPEIPARTTHAAQLAYLVLSAGGGEAGGGHHHRERGEVPWFGVPFCNLVTTRRLLSELGELREDIPWDSDDFDLCWRARPSARFEADPRLRVTHDRYPDSAAELLAELWQKRVRTGMKLVERPELYWRIPAVAACALAPLLGVATAPVAPLLWPVTGVAYAARLAAGAVPVVSRLGVTAVPDFLGLTVAVHGVTLLGVQYGLARAMAERWLPKWRH